MGILDELQREEAFAEALRDWINKQPLVFDEHGNPTISIVYSAHVLLVALLREKRNKLTAMKS